MDIVRLLFMPFNWALNEILSSEKLFFTDNTYGNIPVWACIIGVIVITLIIINIFSISEGIGNSITKYVNRAERENNKR